MELNKEIVKRIKKNDTKVINALYMHSYNILMSQVAPYKINDEDRKTLINNTFVKVIDNIDKYRINTSYSNWIKRIVKNEIIDEYRKNKKHSKYLSPEHSINDLEAVASIDYKIEAEQLEFYLSKVPNASRIVFSLYVVDGYPSKEICSDLSISYETFKWHLKNARKILRLQFQKNQNSNYA